MFSVVLDSGLLDFVKLCGFRIKISKTPALVDFVTYITPYLYE